MDKKKEEFKQIVKDDIKEAFSKKKVLVTKKYIKAIDRKIVTTTKPRYNNLKADTIMKHYVKVKKSRKDRKLSAEKMESIFATVIIAKNSNTYYAYWIVGTKIIRTWCSNWYKSIHHPYTGFETYEHHPDEKFRF